MTGPDITIRCDKECAPLEGKYELSPVSDAVAKFNGRSQRIGRPILLLLKHSDLCIVWQRIQNIENKVFTKVGSELFIWEATRKYIST
jgi:hypothetical protein